MALCYTAVKKNKKKEKTLFLPPLGSVCKWPFQGILIDLLGVKYTIARTIQWSRLEVLKLFHFRDIVFECNVQAIPTY